MKNTKRWKMRFESGIKHKTLYSSCEEEELQGEKERWCVFLEEQTGIPWTCISVTEVLPDGVYVGNRERGD